jgi:L-rhamnose mutarotase
MLDKTRRYCYTLDLVDDPQLIAAYERWHTQVWPEVLFSIQSSGIEEMEIYRYGNRLMMIMQVDAQYSHERKAALDLANEKVQEWEALMWKYQQGLPGAKEGEKWVLMNKIFEL